MRTVILLLLVLLCSILVCPTWATVTMFNGTAASTTITSTTAGHTMFAVTSTSTTPTVVCLNTASNCTGGTNFTKVGCAQENGAARISCIWQINSIPAAKTRFVCGTGCGTTNFQVAWDISNADTTTPRDTLAVCVSSGVCNQPNALDFHPSYSSEVMLTAWDCGGTAATQSTWVGATGSGSGAFPNGNVVDFATGNTAFTTVTAVPDAACGAETGIVIGVKLTGVSQSCQWNRNLMGYSTETTSPTKPTLTAHVVQAGDLVVAMGWCVHASADCGASASMTIGSDTATKTANGGTSGNTAGQPYIFYDVASAAGDQTITFTPGGTYTNAQVAYQVFTGGAGCTISHDVDSALGTGTGATVNTPSITAPAGELIFNATAVQSHATAVNSPWVCNNFTRAGETASCFFVSTVNTFGYILSSSGSSTANNVSQLSSNPWEALLSSFKLTGSSPPATTPDSSEGGISF